MEGKLKRATSKGFGFIETDKKVDFFFHMSQYDGSWMELLSWYAQDKVVTLTFDVDMTTTKEGPRALNVRVVE